MVKNILLALFTMLCTVSPAFSQNTTPIEPQQLYGKWEVLNYSEQGIQVDKKANALPQAIAVWQQVRKERARIWYGYDENWDTRKPRKYEQWELRDSTIEVNRVAEAIAKPYFAVFFQDSTLSLYNKDSKNGEISFAEGRHFRFSPEHRSITIYSNSIYQTAPEWHAQILFLSAQRMTLFLAENAEIVELVKVDFKLP